MFTPKLHDRLFNLVGALEPHRETGGAMTASDVRALHDELLACARLAREQHKIIASLGVAEAMGGDVSVARIRAAQPDFHPDGAFRRLTLPTDTVIGEVL